MKHYLIIILNFLASIISTVMASRESEKRKQAEKVADEAKEYSKVDSKPFVDNPASGMRRKKK